jgi:hypothetical protein
MQLRELKATDWGGLTRRFLRESISSNYRIANWAGSGSTKKTFKGLDASAPNTIFVTLDYEKGIAL